MSDTTEEFARAMVRRLKREASEWVALVETTPEESITDSYFRSVSRLYHSLDESQKRTFLSLVQRNNVEGAASVFAAIEGVSYIEGWDGDFGLTYEGTDLTKYLLDNFIGADQEDEAGQSPQSTH